MASTSLFVALLAPIGVASEASDQDLDSESEPPIVVNGSRISEAPGILTSPDPIDSGLPFTSLDILETLPDVRAVSTAGAGGTSFVSIRGAEPNFAHITIDGVRVSNPSNSAGGGFDFVQLDPTLISSVSLVPSSRSAVYGSDALSGVLAVGLLSPEREGPSIGARASVDSENGFNLSARLAVGWDNGGVLFAGSHGDSGDLTAGSFLKRDQLLARATQKLGAWSGSAFLLYGETEREAFPESSGGPIFAVNRALETRDTNVVVMGASLAAPDDAEIQPVFRVGYYDDNVLADTPAIFPGVFSAVPALTSDTDFDRLELTGSVRFRLSETFDVVAGIGYQEETASSSGTIDFGFLVPTAFAIDRDQASLFAEAEWRPLDDLKLSLAGRNDWFDGFDEATVQGSVEYHFSDSGWRMFGGYSEGFRLPSLFALAFPLTANPNLRPERSVSWDAGLAWKGETTALRASFFLNDYTDLIDFDPILFTTVNRSETQIAGISLSGNGEIVSAIEWNGSVTFLDFDSAVPLRGRPDWFGHARLAWRADDGLRVGAAATFNSDFLETSIPTGVIELEGHVSLDLFAHWQLTEAVELSFAVRNATGAEWQDAVGFPAPGRVLRAQASFGF